MKVVTLLGWWTLWTALTLLNLTGEAESAARFLSNVPHDDYVPDAHLEDPNTPDFDADVKLPGRHYPKLPYRLNPHDPFPEPPYLHNTHHHDARYNPHSGTSRHDGHHQSGYPGYAYPNYGHLNTEPSYSDYDGFVDDEEGDWRVDDDGEGLHLVSPQSDTADPSPEEESPPPTEQPHEGPRFDRTQPRSITVQAGKTAVLVCRVHGIGDKSVSWMRHEDLHILTVDKYKYSTDGRLSVVYDEAQHEWLLKIQGVAQHDAGRYECQVSTKPVLSFIVNLEVVVPSATILNGPEIYVHRGSLINLTCIVDHTTERPLYIVWYHYNEVIDYEDMGGVVVVTQSGHNTVSHLLVKRAKSSDSGKYTCRPSNGEDASVMLHVLNGEHPAAMQTNRSGRSVRSLGSALVVGVGVALSAVVLLCRC